MWCTKCHYGSAIWKPSTICNTCGGKEFTSKNPLPPRALRSIRAMNKRSDYQKPTSKARTMTDDVEQVIKDAQHNK